MASTPQLFDQRDWVHPEQPAEPVIWLREIRLLYRLEAGSDAEIRRIKLHPGLNIVWAKPAESEEPEPALRGKGHDVGKTSFCRLIRHLLGEEHYGNAQLRRGLTACSALEHAWVIGEIILKGQVWTVARAFYAGARPFALRGVGIEDAFAIPAADRIKHEDFVTEVSRTVVQSFAVQTFDGAGEYPIEWLHVLEWLARDQESHLAGLLKWRDPSSDHGSPELDADDAQYLVRCVLNLTDVKERQVIEERDQLGKEKTTATENLKYYERRITEALQRARDELPGGSDLPSVGEPLFVDLVTQHAQKLTAARRGELEKQNAQLGLDEAEAALEKAIEERALAESRYKELKELVDESTDSLARFTEKQTGPTVEDLDDLDAIIANLRPDRAYCEIPVSIALFKCPLLQAKRLSPTDETNEPLTVTELARAKRQEIEKQLEGLSRNLRQLETNLSTRQNQESIARQTRDKLRERRSELIAEIEKLDPEVTAWTLRAEDAEMSSKQLDETRQQLSQIEGKLERCKLLQDEAQKEGRKRQRDVEEIFMALCRYLKGDNADGELKFTRDEIKARIGSGGGAYNALSNITFDFAALLARLNGIGHHPGLLIHDSPRESDMEPSLYLPLFRLIEELESAAPKSFQYIITTTAPPPTDLAKPPHLILELDGATQEGHLFKQDF
jgi:hypothetical protein